jgi:hypothetical protein
MASSISKLLSCKAHEQTGHRDYVLAEAEWVLKPRVIDQVVFTSNCLADRVESGTTYEVVSEPSFIYFTDIEKVELVHSSQSSGMICSTMAMTTTRSSPSELGLNPKPHTLNQIAICS